MTDYSAIDFSAGAVIPPPAAATAFGGSLVEGTGFYVTAGSLYLKGFRWWVAASGGQSTAPQQFALRQATGSGTDLYVPGTLITSGALAPGLNQITYPVPVPLTEQVAYTVATGLSGAFPFTQDYWSNAAYAGGVSSGPATVPSGFDGSEPPGVTILQSEFVTGSSDPSGSYTSAGNNNFNAWLDAIITDAVPAGVSFRAFPSLPSPVADLAGTDAATIALQFTVSVPATARAWHYSPPTATGLPTGAAIWDVATQDPVTQTTSAAWSGPAGSGWVYCTNLPAVTLAAGTPYKVSTFLGTSGSEWFLATTNFWGTGIGQGGRASGILSLPDNAHASPGQGSYTAGAFTYPQTIDNEQYWIDIEVTPAAAPAAAVSSVIPAWLAQGIL